MRYAIVIEQAGSHFPAYIPDRSGCVATGSTAEGPRPGFAKPSPSTSM